MNSMLLILSAQKKTLRPKCHSKQMSWHLIPGLQIVPVVPLLTAEWPLCMSHKGTWPSDKLGRIS